MKVQKLFLSAAIAALIGGSLASCSDEETIVIPDYKPAKATDFRIYSGKTVLSSTMDTRAANVNGNLWYQNWERPTNVTEEEKAKVIAEFSKKREGATNTLQVTWKNYWVQQVYKGEAEYLDGFNQNIGVASDKMNHLLAYNQNYDEEIWWPEHVVNHGGYEHINNFNSGDNTTVYTDDVTHEQFIGTTLMVDMATDGRDEQFGYHNSVDSKNHFEYIILKIDGAYYVGFDFYATHPEGQDANKNMDVERDWIFNDWIVKISPAQLLDGEPENPDLGGGEGVDPTPDPVDPVDPSDPEEDDFNFYDYPHVEVNLSVNDEMERWDYIATKLSIHVRDTTDVEVFIPVPAEYYCDADDMNIVLSHQLEQEIHSPLAQESSYVIDGQTVRATVSFEMGGIRVTTQGVNAQVLKYLRSHYGDGLTFEVWNYYNGEATRSELKPLLDASTVTFTKEPPYYVNAFALLDGLKNAWDCTVTPPTEYSKFIEHKGAEDNHNDYNVIYQK